MNMWTECELSDIMKKKGHFHNMDEVLPLPKIRPPLGGVGGVVKGVVREHPRGGFGGQISVGHQRIL